MIMRRPEVTLRLMRDMHDVGLDLHIDDFGTGYSSLETLHRSPVDAFKIDRPFIRELTPGDRSADLVRVIVAMRRALGLEMVAGGIETAAQLAFLREIGCASGQGFRFRARVPADQVPHLLGRTPEPGRTRSATPRRPGPASALDATRGCRTAGAACGPSWWLTPAGRAAPRRSRPWSRAPRACRSRRPVRREA